MASGSTDKSEVCSEQIKLLISSSPSSSSSSSPSSLPLQVIKTIHCLCSFVCVSFCLVGFVVSVSLLCRGGFAVLVVAVVAACCRLGSFGRDSRPHSFPLSLSFA